jgi:hypothetical protein
MAMNNPEKIPIDKMLKSVDYLSPKEQEQLRLKLDSSARHKEWRDLVNATALDSKGQTPLSDEEILTEVKAAKQTIRERLAKDSH